MPTRPAVCPGDGPFPKPGLEPVVPVDGQVSPPPCTGASRPGRQGQAEAQEGRGPDTCFTWQLQGATA